MRASPDASAELRQEDQRPDGGGVFGGVAGAGFDPEALGLHRGEDRLDGSGGVGGFDGRRPGRHRRGAIEEVAQRQVAHGWVFIFKQPIRRIMLELCL